MKSKLIFRATIAVFFITSCQPGLRISGTTPSSSSITISHSVNETQEDIAVIVPKDGKFSHRIKPINKAEPYLLLTDLENTIGHFFIGEEGHIYITIDTTGTVRATGTGYNDLLQSYYDQRGLLFSTFKAIYFPHQEKRAREKGASKAEVEQLNKEATALDSLEKKIIETDIQFIKNNINNVAGQLILNNLVLYSPTTDQLKEIADAADKETQKMESFQRIAKHIEQAEQAASESRYTDVTLKQPNGEDAAISGYLKRKKYTLLYIYIPSYFIDYDFYQLNNLYKQLQNDAVEMVSVAINENTTSWQKLLAKYSMPWAQLADTTGVDGNLATAYSLDAFPYHILLDKNGMILYRNRNLSIKQLNELTSQ